MNLDVFDAVKFENEVKRNVIDQIEDLMMVTVKEYTDDLLHHRDLDMIQDFAELFLDKLSNLLDKQE